MPSFKSSCFGSNGAVDVVVCPIGLGLLRLRSALLRMLLRTLVDLLEGSSWVFTGQMETLKYFVFTCMVLLLPGLAAAYRPLRARWKAARAAYEFRQQYPLFAVLLRRQRGAITKLCRGPLAASLGPGSISVLHVCALLNDAASVGPLVGAGACLNDTLTRSWVDPRLKRWLATGRGRLPRHKIYWLLEGSTALQLAVLLGHRRTVQALVLAGADVASVAGDTLLSYCKLDPPAIQPLVHAVAASQVALAPGQVRTLLHAAIDCSQPAAFSELLDDAVSWQVALSAADIKSLTTAAVCSGAPQPLQNLIDLLGVDPSGKDGDNTCFAAMALQEGRLATFEQLLKAGAAVDGQFLYSILERRDFNALLVLLKHGRSNFVGSPAIMYTDDGFAYYNCPVLCLLHHNVECHLSGLLHPPPFQPLLLMAEAMAAAGLKPTVNSNAITGPGACHWETFNPLKACSPDLDIEGINKHLALVFQPAGWQPEIHHRYPAQLQGAVATVLLMVTRGRRAPGGCEDGCLLFSGRPAALLVEVLHLAAWPLSACVRLSHPASLSVFFEGGR